jgi:heme exporter protein A
LLAFLRGYFIIYSDPLFHIIILVLFFVFRENVIFFASVKISGYHAAFVEKNRKTSMHLFLEQVSKHYQGRVIFEAVSGRIALHDSFVVTGPNGSGKSTLLKILCGLLRPTSGTVRMEQGGRELKPEERKYRIGFVSPEINLYDRLTALENLAFFTAARGLPVRRSVIVDLLEKLQLKDSLDQPVGQFSSGMKQRMKLACAVLHEPPVLVLDEPGSNLDDRGKQLFENTIRAQRQKGIVVIATNEPGEVEKFGQKVLHLGRAPGGPDQKGPPGGI